MIEYEFRSKSVTLNEHEGWNKPDKIEQTCNDWAKEGFEVFSVIVPQGSNYNTYRLTAKRQIRRQPSTAGRKFR